MLCEICKKRQATVHFRESINGKVSEKFLCAECAKSSGYYDKINVFEPSFVNPAEFISSVFEPRRVGTVACKSCGTTAEEFRETGFVGCSECYTTFGDAIMPVVRRVQGATKHVGKSPKRAEAAMTEREKLEELLKQLVAAEQYEEAIKIRDKIKDLKE